MSDIEECPTWEAHEKLTLKHLAELSRQCGGCGALDGPHDFMCEFGGKFWQRPRKMQPEDIGL